MEETLEKLKYPIGKHIYPGALSANGLAKCLSDIEALPEKLERETAHLSHQQLDTPYRPEGWTVRQVLHHFSDSHMNAFIRFKMALSEDKPIIKPYHESAWSAMKDSREAPAELGLDLIRALHKRWMILLRSLSAQDLQRSYVHPEYDKAFKLEEAISMYAWHCNHHLAHITQLKRRNNWH